MRFITDVKEAGDEWLSNEDVLVMPAAIQQSRRLLVLFIVC